VSNSKIDLQRPVDHSQRRTTIDPINLSANYYRATRMHNVDYAVRPFVCLTG